MFARVSCRKRAPVMSEPKNDQIEFGNQDKTPKPAWPWAGLLLVVLVSLLMPALLLISVRTIPAAVWALLGHAFALGGAGFRPPSPH